MSQFWELVTSALPVGPSAGLESRRTDGPVPTAFASRRTRPTGFNDRLAARFHGPKSSFPAQEGQGANGTTET